MKTCDHPFLMQGGEYIGKPVECILSCVVIHGDRYGNIQGSHSTCKNENTFGKIYWNQWRINSRGGGGRQLTILPNFPKNCMKLKEFGTRPHPPPPRSATGNFEQFDKENLENKLKSGPSAQFTIITARNEVAAR